MKKVKQKALSLLLSFAMLFGMVQGAAVPAFAVAPAPVNIGGAPVDSNDWYAKTDVNGIVTKCTDTDDWNVHVVKSSEGTPTATVTLKGATIANPSFDAPAIGVTGYNLNIVLEGGNNRIGIDAENSIGYAIYSTTSNDIAITGKGDLTVTGRYGIKVDGSGAVKIDTTGSLSIISKVDMVRTGGSVTVSAKWITAKNGSGFYGGAVSLTATDGDIDITASSDGINASSVGVTVAAPKGAVSLSGNSSAIYSDSNDVKVSAKNDITMTGAVSGGAVSAASQTGNVTIKSSGKAIYGAKTSVALSAPQGDVTLTSGNGCNVILGSGYTLAITAHGKLDATSSNGIEGYTSAAIKADTVRVALTGDDYVYGFNGGALTITNPSGGNCSEVSVSGAGQKSNGVKSSGDVTVKANQVVIAANFNDTTFYMANSIYAAGNVTIGDEGVIVGTVSVKGTNNISKNIVQASQNGGDASGGLNLNTDTPTKTTYYKAGDGYAFFTPANGTLVLHNATIHNTKVPSSSGFGPEQEGIALPAGKITLQAEGTNKIISDEGNGIGYGANLTLSGDGTLTMEKTKCGISLSNGSFTFADGAKVTLNSTVAAGNLPKITSTVYGNVTVESTDQLNKMDLRGTVTIAKDATLTVPKGKALWLDRATSVTNNGTVINNGIIYLPYNYTVPQIQASNLPGSFLLCNRDAHTYKAYARGSIYAYNEINGDLDFTTPPPEATYYKAGNGYLIFTPASGKTPAALTLHNVDTYPIITLPNAPMTLNLEEKNEADHISASNAVTVSGGGSLDAFLFHNSDSAAVLTVNSGAALNVWYQTADNNNVVTNTIYGNYTMSELHRMGVNSTTKLLLSPGAVLTLTGQGYLGFYKDAPLNYMTIGAGASIVNNNYVILPKDTTAAQIAALPLSGNGVARVATAYDATGSYATAWDTYTNNGAALKTVSGGLDLTSGDHSGKTVANNGYAWDNSTLTLGNAYIEGDVILPAGATVSTTANSIITGGVNDAGDPAMDITFTGTAPLLVNGGINGEEGGTLNIIGPGTKLTVSSAGDYAVLCDTVNVKNGASLAVKAEGDGSIGVEALTAVNVTGGSTLTAGCDFGVYIIDGKLTVDKSSKLITNGSVAPFCVVDTTGKTQSQVLALPGVPNETEIASVKGTLEFDSGITPPAYRTYWSLAPKGGSLSVSNEGGTPVTLTGAVAKSVSFVKPADPTDNSGNNSTSHSVPSLSSVLTDAATNMAADLSGASFPSGVTSVALSVTPQTSAGIPQGVPGGTADSQGAAAYRLAVSNTSLNMIGSPSLYNLKLLDQNGSPITGFTGTVRVRIPLPAGLRGTPRVLRYESDGTFTDMKAAVENGFLAFSTDHFSYYVIAGTGDSIILDTTSYQMPVNGSYQIGVKLTGSKATSVKFRSTNEKTATVTKLKNGNYQVAGKNPGTAYIMFDVYDNKNKFFTHASVRVDVKAGIRPRGDSTRQYGIF